MQINYFYSCPLIFTRDQVDGSIEANVFHSNSPVPDPGSPQRVPKQTESDTQSSRRNRNRDRCSALVFWRTLVAYYVQETRWLPVAQFVYSMLCFGTVTPEQQERSYIWIWKWSASGAQERTTLCFCFSVKPSSIWFHLNVTHIASEDNSITLSLFLLFL